MENNNIGLVAWGLKLGYQIFFDNSPSFQAHVPEVEATLEDIRGIVNFSQPGYKFFSLEFTKLYKVYSIYNTIYDWRSRDGAYFAFTLFVPHETALPQGRMLETLNALAENYKETYIENFQIKKEPEDPSLFIHIINEIKTGNSPLGAEKFDTSGNRIYAAVHYKEELDLNAYFDDPYRDEFRHYKEIYFVEEDLAKRQILRVTPNAPLLEVSLSNKKYPLDIFLFNLLSDKQIANAAATIQVDDAPETQFFNNALFKENNQITIKKIQNPFFKPLDNPVTFLAKDKLENGKILIKIGLHPVESEIKVRVVDEQDHPLPGAKVYIDKEPEKTTPMSGLVKSAGKYPPGASCTIQCILRGYTQNMNMIEFILPLEDEELKLVMNKNPEPLNQKDHLGIETGHTISNAKRNTNIYTGILKGVLIVGCIALVVALVYYLYFDQPSTSNEHDNTTTNPNPAQKDSSFVDYKRLKDTLSVHYKELDTMVISTVRLQDLKLNYDFKDGILSKIDTYKSLLGDFNRNEQKIDTLLKIKEIKASKPTESTKAKSTGPTEAELNKKLNSPNFLYKSWAYYANIISQLNKLPKSPKRTEMLNHAKLLQQIVRLRGHYLSVEKTETLNIYKKEPGKSELTATGLEPMLYRRITDQCKSPLTPEQQDILQLWLKNPK